MKFLFFLLSFSLVFSSLSCQNHPTPSKKIFRSLRSPPFHCKVWFDGCNKCSTHKGQIRNCSKNTCFIKKPAKCLEFVNEENSIEIKQKKCRQKKGLPQYNKMGDLICLMENADYNQRCNDSSECDGICLYNSRMKKGFCNRYSPFIGCATEYKNGNHFYICN